MPQYTTTDIRNIALVGHGGAGKTSLAEALLHKSGATRRLGSVNDKTSHLDYAEEEKEKGCSLDSAVCHADHNGKRINIIDTPGSIDFAGPAIAALAAADTAVCVISAKDGIQVNTRKMMERAKDYGLARMIVVNKIDAESANFEQLVGQIAETFGPECVCVNLPTGNGRGVIDCYENDSGESELGDVAARHEKVVEAIVGVDDDLMEKYLSGELGDEELSESAAKATAGGVIVPVVFTDAAHDVGISELLKVIGAFCPDPTQAKHRELVNGDNRQTVSPDCDGPFVGLVFKITSDPKSHIKYSALRCLGGQLKSDTTIHTLSERKGFKPGHIHSLQGSEHTEIEQGGAGDIVALAKLDLKIGDVVFSGDGGTIEMPALPVPMFSIAIEPESRSDADKISGALHKFTEEDPCFKAEREASTHELVISGMGDIHLRTMLARMERFFKLKVTTHPPRVPYRETTTLAVKDVEYTHKKQTGGAGQFARVFIGVEPNERGAGYEFIDDIFGGAIDQQFRPSVDKGVRSAMAEGILAGYPVVDVKVRLTDGKTHPVDSKDIAFQIAGKHAFREAFLQCKPILLEPIVNIEVTVPAENVGDIQGDLASRRGRPVGQDMLPAGFLAIRAQVPLAEVANYNSSLSSISAGQGSYTMELSHYDPVPGNVQQQIIDKVQKQKQEAAAAK